MRRTRFDDAYCPIARTTDLLGDWWTPLVVRQLMWGQTRFEEIADALGISRPVLSTRLKRLEHEGIVTRSLYQDHPPRHEYRLTEKGRALFDVLAVMWRFGEDWLFNDETHGAPVELVDVNTGCTVRPAIVDERTGAPIVPTDVRIRSTSRPRIS